MNRLWARLQGMVAFGQTTAAVDDAGATASVQARLTAIETHPALQVISQFGFSSSAPKGSGVVVLFASGDRSKGVVLGTVNAGGRRKGLLEGEVSVGPSAMVEIHFSEGVVTIKHPTKVRIETPRLECTGEVVAKCDGPFVTLSQHLQNGQKPTPNT